ncbi:TetR/AcrR family transcriptional regulator [Streptomonospora halophila]|uniref:TetR/AcrR family transcriptional regulator n=1 Tax=Streptomonospora halophila TaxID=427369 RepID=A0ABP9GP28_9ACTN
MESAASGTDHRRRPRRRGAALHDAIVQAVVAELAEVGYAGLTMEGVAERAQASKGSLYRRWPGKLQLVMDTAYHLLPEPADVADTGTLRGDLLAMLRLVNDNLAGPAGQAMRGVISEVLQDDTRAAQVRARARGTSIAAVREVVRRADARGEIDGRAVTERQLETGHALLRYHFLSHGGPVADEVVTGIVDEVLLPLFRAR